MGTGGGRVSCVYRKWEGELCAKEERGLPVLKEKGGGSVFTVGGRVSCV